MSSPDEVRPAAVRPPWKRVLKWTALALAMLLVITVVGAVVIYRHLSGNIHHEGIVIPGARPSHLGRAENILLIGSDTRAGAGDAKYGSGIAGARSDTTILVHLSANGGKAILVSIPRDSYVQIPACALPDHKTSAPQMNKFNAAFAIGGPSCTIATVEHLTDIRIDHFVMVDFAGFKRMVDALGGVTVCVSQPINDPIVKVNGHYEGSGLKLPAGNDTLNGEQALGFVRARYTLGDGSDLGRIKRQQMFISSMIRKATSTGLLINLPKLYSFLDAATKSLTTDPGFGLRQMQGLASDLHGLQPGKVALLTVPLADTNYNVPIGGYVASTVLWDKTRADTLWTALRGDGPLPGTEPDRKKGKPSPKPTLIVAPSAIHVRVLNGTSQSGLASRAAEDLRRLGFQIDDVGDADSSGYTQTVVRYGTTKNESSQTLEAALPGSLRQLDGTLGSSLVLIVGSDYKGAQAVTLASATPTPSTSASPLDVTTADKNVCTG